MRSLCAQDARAMAAIHAQGFERSWDALEMATHIQKDICFGCNQNGVLAGFIIISAAADQAEILTIATADIARRKGIGRRLLDGAMSAIQKRGISELFLEVAEDNAGAIALYRATGLTPIGRRPAYYRREAGRVAALTFSKKLA